MKKHSFLKVYNEYSLYIYPVLVGLISLLLIGLVFPQVIKLISNNEALRVLSEKAIKLNTKDKALQNLDDNSLGSKVKIMMASLPQDLDFSTIVGIVQGVVSKSSYSLTSVQLGSGNALNSGVSGYILRIEVFGPKANFAKLLDDLEDSYRVMRVTSVENTFDKGGDVVKSVISLEAYYSLLPKSLGSIEAPLPVLSAQDEDTINKLSRLGVVTPSSETATLAPRGKSDPFE